MIFRKFICIGGISILIQSQLCIENVFNSTSTAFLTKNMIHIFIFHKEFSSYLIGQNFVWLKWQNFLRGFLKLWPWIYINLDRPKFSKPDKFSEFESIKNFKVQENQSNSFYHTKVWQHKYSSNKNRKKNRKIEYSRNISET